MFSCPLCTKTFKSSKELNYHTVSHRKEKPYKCPKCSAAFGRQSGLNQHVSIVHDGIKQIKNRNSHCPMCSYKCYDKTMLQVHLRKHSAERPFSCSTLGCHFNTKYEESLRQHVRSAHNAEKPLECPSDGCSYKTKTRRQLLSNFMQHQLVHTKIQRFKCQASNCSFASHLKRSVQQHFDAKHRKKDVLCTEPGCKFKFGSIALVKRHLKSHMNPLLKCPYGSCNFSTKYKTSLLTHISHRHENQKSPTLTGPRNLGVETDETTRAVRLHCRFPDCGFQTKFQQHYDHHVTTHRKEEKRKHVCSFCFSRFIALDKLRIHIQRHTAEKHYSCLYCNYTTVVSFDLRRHSKTAHDVYLRSYGKEDEVSQCRTCGRHCFSYSESVLHSMSHLQPAVVLGQLKLEVL